MAFISKQTFLEKVAAKPGFVSIIQDSIAPDNVAGDTLQKRYLIVNTLNSDGTAGKAFVYYVLNTVDNTAAFYNAEVELFDLKTMGADQKKYDNIEQYIKATFFTYLITDSNMNSNTIFADAYSLNVDGTLTKQRIAAYKKGGNPITHAVII